MGIKFKYIRKKGKINNFPESPGKAGQSINGKMGLRGKIKSSIYITDYDPSDEYTKNIILGKIDEGYTLAMNSVEKITDVYTVGDLILTRGNDVYRLKEGGNNHKFDLVFMGSIQKRPTNKTTIELLDESISQIVLSINRQNNYDFTRGLCNRSLSFTSTDAGGGKIYNPFVYPDGEEVESFNSMTIPYRYDYRQIYGVEIEPIIIASEDILDDFDFILDIYIPNEKSYEYDSLKFHIDSLGSYATGNFTSTNLSFSEEPVYPPFLKNVKFDKKLSIVLHKSGTKFKKCFISDMSCDKLHLFGNEIKSNILDSADRTLNKIYCHNVTNIPSMEMRYGLKFEPASNSTPSSVLENDQNRFVDDITYTGIYPYLMYCTRNDYSGNPNRKFINYRGGESAYFSAIVPGEYFRDAFVVNDSSTNMHNIGSDVNIKMSYCSFPEYINNVQCTNLSMYVNPNSNFSKDKDSTGEWVVALNRNLELRYIMFKEIYNFISSPKNKYELRCIKNNGETYILDLKGQGSEKLIWKIN